MNAQHIMDLYAKNERLIQYKIPNAKRVADDNIVKYIYEGKRDSFIYYFKPVTLTIDELIKREINYFDDINKSVEWKTYATDNPKDIGERLKAHGFIEDETESFLVRDIGNYEPNLNTPKNVVCLKVTSKQMFLDSFEIQNTEFPLNDDDHVERYWPKYMDDDNAHLYVLYENDQPVATARVDFTPDSVFAGLWAGTTLKDYRGRGYYQVLLNHRIHEAKLRGRQYVTIDAMETSRPIVEKHGFEFITTTTPYVYNPRALING